MQTYAFTELTLNLMICTLRSLCSGNPVVKGHPNVEIFILFIHEENNNSIVYTYFTYTFMPCTIQNTVSGIFRFDFLEECVTVIYFFNFQSFWYSLFRVFSSVFFCVLFFLTLYIDAPLCFHIIIFFCHFQWTPALSTFSYFFCHYCSCK